MTTLTISARQPFSFLSVVNSHGWVQLAPFNFDKGTETLTYILRLSSGRVLDLILLAAPGGVRVETDDLGPAEEDEISRTVAWMLALDQDFSAFYAEARKEPKLAHVEAKAQGRVLRSPTLFEDVVKTILTTNTLWAATKRMTANLVEQFGDPLPGDPDRKAFPTPERLAASTPEALKNGTRVGYRAPYVHELAVRVASGELDLEALKGFDLPTPELRKRLLAIKGVGAYAAANLLMILGRYDFLPVDSWALKVVSHEWHDGQPIGKAEVESAFERWGAFKGLAYWFWDWAYFHQEK
ncbi:MAG: DNA-3-methyladenine glycosylase 2 family protein [Chloroflexi bacterium]|nr:DNA-3-methyladenine glycosylase 2 family protein [Chloroflexota bacterium]